MMTSKPFSISLHVQSPTGNTTRVAKALAAHIEAHVAKQDWYTNEPLCMIGVPVYAGRVPNLMLPWLKALRGEGKKAVALVTYGGRHYDDALIELVDHLTDQGFHVVGAGAFVAPHSFDPKLIQNRPNAQDDQALSDFAAAIVRSAQNSRESLDLFSLGLGQRPYRNYLKPNDEAGQPIDFKRIKPAVDYGRCTRCGACVKVCPHRSIPIDAPHTTPGKCSKCNACVQICPVSARMFVDLGYLWHLNELRAKCSEQALNLWTVGVSLEPLALSEDIAAYKQFVKAHYDQDENFRDYITPVIDEFYKHQSLFSKRCQIQGFWIKEGLKEKPLGAVSFLVHKAYPSVLQILFMEYPDRLDVAYAIWHAANKHAKAMGAWRITVGLSGHVNYGLGLSISQNHRATFGAPYSKTYYAAHLDHLAKDFPNLVRKGVTSYAYKWSDAGFPMNDQQMDRLARRSAGKLSYRIANIHRFALDQQDLAIYTKLNNACFTKHDFYYPRHPGEDLALFKDLRHFMVHGSLIFAYYENEPVGFLLWYPDWSEWMRPGETLSIATYLKCMAKGAVSKPSAFKIVEWAVLPEHAKKGVPLAMLKACEAQIKKYHFSQMYTSWILDENINSNTFAKHWATPSEHYAAYRMDIDHHD